MGHDKSHGRRSSFTITTSALALVGLSLGLAGPNFGGKSAEAAEPYFGTNSGGQSFGSSHASMIQLAMGGCGGGGGAGGGGSGGGGSGGGGSGGGGSGGGGSGGGGSGGGGSGGGGSGGGGGGGSAGGGAGGGGDSAGGGESGGQFADRFGRGYAPSTDNLAKTAPEPIVPAEPAKYLVLFDTDVSEPDAWAQTIIENARAAALKLGDVRITVAGHTDRVATDSYNQVLSEMRSQAVAKLLIAGGIAPEAVSTEAYGELQPLEPTADAVDAYVNRRVEIRVEPVSKPTETARQEASVGAWSTGPQR